PAAGHRDGTLFLDDGSIGYYWSSSLYESDPGRAYRLYFNLGNVRRDHGYRYYGRTVRAVCP
ncbi:MAG: hypothetical protein J6U57_05080, partial [Bacteroidales bacterium]|nr:hypothetical protein [Bacteroidales bacterium]